MADEIQETSTPEPKLAESPAAGSEVNADAASIAAKVVAEPVASPTSVVPEPAPVMEEIAECRVLNFWCGCTREITVTMPYPTAYREDVGEAAFQGFVLDHVDEVCDYMSGRACGHENCPLTDGETSPFTDEVDADAVDTL